MRMLLVLALTGCTAADAVCGDGVAGGDEACDGADLRGATCASAGFNAGTPSCLPQCVLDVRGCSTIELCGNGRDDDGDGDKDCLDADCAGDPACAVCGDGAVTGGEQCDDGNRDAGDCCDGCRAEPGCEVEPDDSGATAVTVALEGGAGERRGTILPAGDVDLYRVEVPPGSTGTLLAETRGASGDVCPDTAVTMTDATDRTLAVDDDAGDGLCSRARAAGLAPGTTLVRVAASPFAPEATFAYRLSLALSLSPCGDGVPQEGQECDDGNHLAGDGCSDACVLETRAAPEPNDDAASASGPFTPPFAVAGAADVALGFDLDWYAFDLAAPAALRIETFVDGAVDCSALLAAPALHEAGGRLIAGASLAGVEARSCGRVESGALAAGHYLIVVEARPAPGRYRMMVTEEK